MNSAITQDCQLFARDYYQKPANFYENFRAAPERKTIRDFIESAKKPPTQKQRIVLKAKTDDERKAAKRRLPFWQLQSAPTARGEKAALEAEQNGVFVLDIDCHDGETIDTQAIVETAKRIPFTLAALKTASGRGIAIIAAIAKEISEPWKFAPDIPKSSEAVEAAQKIVFEGAGILLNAPIDPKANNPERLRFQCCRVLWQRGENEPITPYTAPDAIELIKAEIEAKKAFTAEPIETYDQDEKGAEEGTEELESCFFVHPLSTLAKAYQGDAGPGSMGTAAAIATIAALVDVKSELAGDTHAARARVVVLAYSGAGKTDIFDIMAKAIETHPGIIFTNPKTTARLREDIRRAGTETKVADDGGAIVTAKAYADHILCAIDEAGDHMHQRSNDLSGLDLLGFIRELHGASVLLEGLKDQPSMRMPAAFTCIFWSTPEQYAKFSGQVTGADGETRRVLEFIEKKPETAKTIEEAIARRSRRRGNEMMVFELADEIAERFKRPGQTIRATQEAITAAGAGIYPALLRAGLDESAAISLIFNYAAFAAVIRIAHTNAEEIEITPEDIRATACVLRATAIRARAQLAALEEREGDKLYKPENAVWCEIRDRIKEGNARTDKMQDWIANRPPVYRETFAGMMGRGELTTERDGKKYILRFTTPQERESKKASGPSVWDGSTEKGKEYSECRQEEKEKRVLAYIAKYEQDNPIVKGQRDNNLRQLRGRLGHAGMTDDIAEQVFTQKALESGLTARDAARLWRQGGLNE